MRDADTTRKANTHVALFPLSSSPLLPPSRTRAPPPLSFTPSHIAPAPPAPHAASALPIVPALPVATASRGPATTQHTSRPYRSQHAKAGGLFGVFILPRRNPGTATAPPEFLSIGCLWIAASFLTRWVSPGISTLRPDMQGLLVVSAHLRAFAAHITFRHRHAPRVSGTHPRTHYRPML